MSTDVVLVPSRLIDRNTMTMFISNLVGLTSVSIVEYSTTPNDDMWMDDDACCQYSYDIVISTDKDNLHVSLSSYYTGDMYPGSHISVDDSHIVSMNTRYVLLEIAKVVSGDGEILLVDRE
jgi:hypothetical protein